MLRLRKYRVFFISAIAITFLLLQLSRSPRWESIETPVFKKPFLSHTDTSGSRHGDGDKSLDLATASAVGQAQKQDQVKIPQLKTHEDTMGTSAAPPPETLPTKTETTLSNTLAQATSPVAVQSGQTGWLAPLSTARWRKPTEWFPVPTESLIKLPKGTPKSMPTVQASFKKESAEAKAQREARRDKVKAEAIRAWTGYRKFAWTHDELMPVSQRFRDPFCGWAATMVDSLDTLWIMGLKDEFKYAIEVVKVLDFTRTPFRSDIPVFETTIRYLGGLLAAFDVSGGPKGGYTILLDKATELAEVLMDAFDTPNRMPVLYYSWNTAASNAPRRSGVSSVAELGSLSVEFTRLAQLTGKDKYYDAVARITDALEDLQNRGTSLPGLFPERIDGSGCNKTTTTLDSASNAVKLQSQAAKHVHTEPQGRLSPGTTAGGQEKPIIAADGKKDLEFTVRPADQGGPSAKGEVRQIVKRDGQGGAPPPASPGKSIPPIMETSPKKADGLPADWDCTPQGLTTGSIGTESFGMGGSQDSAYEYLTKQFILLGGLEPKYRTMYEKVVEGIKKHLLYRPLIEDESRDILFSSKAITTNTGDAQTVNHEYEVTHLTCFLGGMFGLGGRLFNSEEDVDIGKRLADGCVWAYEMSPSGIMPEYSRVVPCKDATNCPWNVTQWHVALDPNYEYRDQMVQDYRQRKAQYEKDMVEYEKLEALWKQAKARAAEQGDRPAPTPMNKGEKVDDTVKPSVSEMRVQEKVKDAVASGDSKIQKREANRVEPGLQGTDGSLQSQLDRKAKSLEAELNLNSAEPPQQVPLMLPDRPSPPVEPSSHEEYVKMRISKERFVPGFVGYFDTKYLLRPEAIESVWYMYRITGDPTWQEKGWRMFEAIISATQTPAGHSAIDDVTKAGPFLLSDHMESFWLAETLKYFYLLFETPDVVSLDDWVLNTEAHPFRRPR